MQHGAATLIPSRPGFSSEELINMINTCGLNRLNQIPSFLITHIKNARTNSTLLQKMKGLGEILYCALDLPREYEDWAYGNGLPIRVGRVKYLESLSLINAYRMPLEVPNVAAH